MQDDFHYYATYCAAFLAGFSHEESLRIGYCSQFVDCCTKTVVTKLGGPVSAVTTQMQSELISASTDVVGLQNITRIWASFHFLPGDLNAQLPRRSRLYMNKYRLICRPNGELVRDTVELAKGRGTESIGIAMHVLADTWAHSWFAGTPSLVINDTNYYFRELRDGKEIPIRFSHIPAAADDPETFTYNASVYQGQENSVMNLGHGRAGHLPDYSYVKYRYMPAWGNYETVTKDNPSDYWNAFCQMVYALKYLRGDTDGFCLDTYDTAAVAPYEKTVREIIRKRRVNAREAWREFGESLSGKAVESFDIKKYQTEYMAADPEGKDETVLGRFFIAAMAQKSMVTNRIFSSGNLLAGFSVSFDRFGFRGIADFRKLIENRAGRRGK